MSEKYLIKTIIPPQLKSLVEKLNKINKIEPPSKVVTNETLKIKESYMLTINNFKLKTSEFVKKFNILKNELKKKPIAITNKNDINEKHSSLESQLDLFLEFIKNINTEMKNPNNSLLGKFEILKEAQEKLSSLKKNIEFAITGLENSIKAAQNAEGVKLDKKTILSTFDQLIKKLEEYKKLKLIENSDLSQTDNLKQQFIKELNEIKVFSKNCFIEIKNLNSKYNKNKTPLSDDTKEQLTNAFSYARICIDTIVSHFNDISNELSDPTVKIESKTSKVYEFLPENLKKQKELYTTSISGIKEIIEEKINKTSIHKK